MTCHSHYFTFIVVVDFISVGISYLLMKQMTLKLCGSVQPSSLIISHCFWGSGIQTEYNGDELFLLHNVWCLKLGLESSDDLLTSSVWQLMLTFSQGPARTFVGVSIHSLSIGPGLSHDMMAGFMRSYLKRESTNAKAELPFFKIECVCMYVRVFVFSFLRCKSHTVQFTHCKCIEYFFKVYTIGIYI